VPASTRRSARTTAAPASKVAASAAAAAAVDGPMGTTFAATPANKRSRRGDAVASTPGAGAGEGALLAAPMPFTPRGGGAGPSYQVAQTPGTVRGPKRGEVLYSMNGSPLGSCLQDDSDSELGGGVGGGAVAGGGRMMSSVKKVTLSVMKTGRRTGRGKGAAAAAAETEGFVLDVGGQEIDINAVEAGGESVEQTVSVLQSLASQVAAQMARLTGRQ